jgi:hypothetical protein
MLIIWYHAFVVRWRMMISEIISQISVIWRPSNVKLFLLYSVFDPVEPHVHCFRVFLLDCVADNSI